MLKQNAARLKANMENLCLKFLTYLYVSVAMTCHHLQESLMIWYLLELALSSKQPTTETKDFLFAPVPAMTPHQHLRSSPVRSLIRNETLAEFHQTLLQITGKESVEGTSKPEFRSHH